MVGEQIAVAISRQKRMIKLQTVANADHVAQARALFQEYAETRKHDPALENFQEEIDNLPGKYAVPDGSLILAYRDGKLAVCVAVHKWAYGVCEMKRLYVSPRIRGRGIGRCLVEAIIKQAAMMGYSRLRLDSIPSMKEAQALYESIGFYEIPAYRHNPNEGTKYYEIALHNKSMNLT